jgi:RNA polymerase sigma-32 factor
MSKAISNLESLVQNVMACLPDEAGDFASPAQRSAYNRGFERLLRALRPRISYFIRRYGLLGHWEDAEQVGAMAVHRAIAGYNPEKAQFTTFVNWQIRGDMQGLRYTVMVDQRAPAKKVKASTVSLQSLMSKADGQDEYQFDIEDDSALAMVERSAENHLAKKTMNALLDSVTKRMTEAGTRDLLCKQGPTATRKPGVAMLKVNSIDPDQLRQLEVCVAESRKVIIRKMFEMDAAGNSDVASEPSPERARHLARKAAAMMREIIAEESQFALLADSLPPLDVLKTRRPANRSTARGRQASVAKLPVRSSVPTKNVSLAI